MTADSTAPRAATQPLGQVLVALFKLRIVALLLLAALAGAFLAADGRPAWQDLAVLLMAGAASAAGASALNEYFERDRDALMRRTAQRRPLTTGAIRHPGVALAAGLALVAAAVLGTLPFNRALAFFLFAGAFIYAVVYTLWLKPRTRLNIVIGGLAGSCAVLSGSAAVGRWDDPAALLLALALFFWTPIHFWSLALVYREDYIQVGIPMLPTQVAPRTAAAWGLAHGIGAGAGVLLLALPAGLGLLYLAPAAAFTGLLIARGARLVAAPTTRRAWQLFHTSNLFLLGVLLAACIAMAVRFS
ncbi:MAG: protoheme IX farnesyltransferase [Anaerolineae bacterium]